MTSPQTPPECTVPQVEVEVTERLDAGSVPELTAVIDRILCLRPHEVVIDLSQCRHIDAAAIELLLTAHQRLTSRRAVLTVRNPDPRVRRILRAAHLDQVLPVVTSAGHHKMSPAGSDPSRMDNPLIAEHATQIRQGLE